MKKIAAIVLVLWSTLVCTAFAPLYVPAINVISTSDPCASLDSSTTALVARMTVDPGCPRKVVINNLIVSLKTAGVWTKLDVLYLFAAHDSQAALLNWVSTSYDGTIVNTVNCYTDLGCQGNGSNSYIDSNFNPTTASSPKYVQNSAHVSFLVPFNDYQERYGDIGGNSSSGNLLLSSSYGPGSFYFKLNGFSQSSYSNGGTAKGNWLANRASSTNQTGYKNGSSVVSNNYTSSAPTNSNIYIFRYGSSYSAPISSLVSIGASLTGTQIADFNTAVQTYMTAVISGYTP